MAPKLVYDKRGIQLWQGDCRNVFPLLRKDAADLIVTDPPYGVDRTNVSRQFNAIAGDDGTLDVPSTIKEALQCLRKNRHLYIFGVFDLSSLPFGAMSTLIWDKEVQGTGNLMLPFGPSHESIHFCTYNPIPYDRKHGAGKLSARVRQGSVLRAKRDDAKYTNHPTQKPVDLLRVLIESSSLLGETVLDPFAGVGSTLVAALVEGRKAIGVEIEEEYCNVAIERLDAVKVEYW